LAIQLSIDTLRFSDLGNTANNVERRLRTQLLHWPTDVCRAISEWRHLPNHEILFFVCMDRGISHDLVADTPARVVVTSN